MPEIARLRTIKKSLAELKLIDPASCITENFLRAQIRAGTIRSIRAGNRALLNMSDLENLIDTLTQPETGRASCEKIRRISER